MSVKHEDNPKSIKYHVKQYLHANKARFEGKDVIDFPAGNGVTSRMLKNIGAKPIPVDLFPEYFRVEGLNCIRGNISETLPLESGGADALICQEGIEHFSDQFRALKEFNRLLKIGGTLLITTPNYSNIRSRMSYFLAETERFNSTMPPNELDSIWMSDQNVSSEIYFGHIFLIGIQKLRALARLTGFKLVMSHKTNVKMTSALLFPLCYPPIWLSNYYTYRKNMRKNKSFDEDVKKAVYWEQFKLNTSWNTLVGANLMVEFVKEREADAVSDQLKSQHQDFGVDT